MPITSDRDNYQYSSEEYQVQRVFFLRQRKCVTEAATGLDMGDGYSYTQRVLICSEILRKSIW